MNDPAKILRERASALARLPDDLNAPAASFEVLEFRLGRERYAVEARFVTEVHPLRSLTSLPSTPALVLGVVSVRGRIVPVFDLKKMVGLPGEGLTDLHRILVVRGSTMELGLLTDAAVAVRLLAEDELQSAPATLTGAGTRYLKGVTSDGLVVLDMEAILADPAIIVHENVEH